MKKTYKGYSLDEAKQELSIWKEAKRSAATGKSYQIAGRSLTRYDLSEINAQISLYSDIVDVLSTSSSGNSGSLGRSGPHKVLARMRRC